MSPTPSDSINTFLQRAVNLSKECLDHGGGPFGAVIVSDGNIVGEGRNRVTIDNDPTAHAEVMAIRDACKNLGTFRLAGCELFASCEPCPMCLAAIHWARIERVYFANYAADAAAIGFDDTRIRNEMNGQVNSSIDLVHVENPLAKEVLTNWSQSDRHIDY